MLARAATACMVTAWSICKLHHFQIHYHAHSKKFESAEKLLQSEVCSNSNLRMELREFDQCETAETFVQIHPWTRAVYSLAEEMHLCGNDRCAIFYMDITDRLPYIFALLCMLLALIIIKLAKDYKHGVFEHSISKFALPHHKID